MIDESIHISGRVSNRGSLSGTLSCPSVNTGGFDIYSGDYELTPKAHQSQTINTKNKVLRDDITVAKIPYWETSNTSNGMTAYIAEEVN